MKVGALLYQRLTTHEGVSALVADRVYPKTAGADQPTEFPYLTYQVVGGDSLFSLNGPSGLAMPRIQIDGWMNGNDSETLEELMEQVRLCISSWYAPPTVQHGYPTGVGGDLPFDEATRAVGKFLEIELHISEATS